MKTNLTPRQVAALTIAFEHFNLAEIAKYALEVEEYTLLFSCIDQTRSLPLSMISKDYSANMLKFFSAKLCAHPKKFIEVKDLNGNTPLHWAALNGHLDMVTSLIQNGANVESIEDFGRTPLHFAALGGHHAVCQALIENGANLDAVEIDGASPLMFAISANRITQDELDAGMNFYYSPAKLDYAGVDVTFNNGQNQSDVAKKLITEGCDINLVGLDNTSAISLARMFGFLDIENELVSRGVNQAIEEEAIDAEALVDAFALALAIDAEAPPPALDLAIDAEAVAAQVNMLGADS